ncbi:hypothetical protein FUAX_11100 [Fulvitalea axinellae]|uniref:Smr domain-containing protein n=1 Tax=Fulvitalea axinellae TaxID=1182444 RepID=A0AAU9CYF5_9BACT|nr:hypothetical protein FUAX_11100 [Fulvitalea axinellae]
MGAFNIGDRVRLLKSNEEGVVTKINEKRATAEIEIEDGFQIEVLAKELVLISQEEKKHFGKSRTEEVSPGKKEKKNRYEAPELSADKGIFLAFFDHGNDLLSVYLINNTDYEVVYSASDLIQTSHKGIMAGSLLRKSKIKIREVNLKRFESWATMCFRFMFHSQDFFSKTEFFEKKLKFKASGFHKGKRLAPILEKEGYVFQLDVDAPKVDPEKLKESLTDKAKKAEPKEERHDVVKPPAVVDLHIEKLTDDHAFMSNSEMLKLQLKTFQDSLDNAIASGMGEITFIHGLGNGVLRDEIQKTLSKDTRIQFFQDAQKSRFGYGATLVRIF